VGGVVIFPFASTVAVAFSGVMFFRLNTPTAHPPGKYSAPAPCRAR
jgi:hypothetical protein